MTDEVKTDEVQADVKDTDLEVTTTDEASDGITAPEADGTTPKVDATEKPENSAAIAFKYREEKRKRERIEKENADLKAKMLVVPTDKPSVPSRDAFEEEDKYDVAMAEYYDKLTDWKLEQRDQITSEKSNQEAFHNKNQKLYETYEEKVGKAVEKYPDYIDLVEKTTFDNTIREAIFKSEHSAEIAYHIAKNPDLGEKLLNSSAIDVALEVRDLDLRLKKSLNSKTSSSAPDPITPVNDSEVITDKDPSKMSMDEYMKYERAETIKKLKNKQETGRI